jgi:glycosyltransferase involved in cell wall biosynthesis
MAPLISVLTPVFNGVPYMETAIQSVLDQTVRDFEYILMDDGSTDRSLEFLRAFAGKDPRLHVVSREYRNYVRALNEGLAMARGEFVARMDADDIALPDRFEKQVRYLREHPECVVVGGRVLLIDAEGAPLREMCVEQTHEEIDGAHIAGRGCMITHPAMMARREAMIAIGGYRTEFQCAEDLDLFLRMAEYGKIANLPDVVLLYRQHLSSVGYSKFKAQQMSIIRAVRAACKRRGVPEPEGIGSRPLQAPTVADAHRKWAWWALGTGHVASARKHAARALRREPFSLESWRAMYCALRGH